MTESCIICDCNDVSKDEIVDEIKNKNLKTVDEVVDTARAGSACGGCQVDIQHILNEINN